MGDAAPARVARWADSPAEVAASSDVLFSIVGFPADVREVVLGRQGVLRHPARSKPRPVRAAPSRSTRRSRAATSARARPHSRSGSAATQRAGLDPLRVIASVGSGAAAS